MTKQKRRQYEMLMRVQDFGSTHQPLFPEGSLGAQALTELAESVAETTHQAVARQGAVGEGRHTRREDPAHVAGIRAAIGRGQWAAPAGGLSRQHARARRSGAGRVDGDPPHRSGRAQSAVCRRYPDDSVTRAADDTDGDDRTDGGDGRDSDDCAVESSRGVGGQRQRGAAGH